MRSLLKNKKGFAPAITAAVGVIAIIVIVITGLIVTGQLSTVADGYNLGATGNSTRETLFSNAYNALNLMTILPVVLVAGVVVLVVAGMMYVRTENQ